MRDVLCSASALTRAFTRTVMGSLCLSGMMICQQGCVLPQLCVQVLDRPAMFTISRTVFSCAPISCSKDACSPAHAAPCFCW